MGYQVGLTPEQSQQCIAVINGKPAMWGDDMLALCMAHKDFEDIEEYPIRKGDHTVIGYVCTVHRKGKKPKTSEFTLDMAKRAGLLAKGGVWNQYPERMLKLRARGFSLRDAFPDALKGIKPREEVEDYIDVEYKAVDSHGSRTEQLKHDYMSKKDTKNVEKNFGLCAPSSNQSIEQEDTNLKEPERVDESREKAPSLHHEIERLIADKGFAEERLEKALKFYEVSSISELNTESAEHFHAQLMKL
jgi:hypothetical protein